MTLTEYLDAIAEKLGVSKLPDRLLTTYLEAFAKNEGVNVSALPDKLASTYLKAILKARGLEYLPDDLMTTQLENIAATYGAINLPDRLVSTYLEAIIANIGTAVRTHQFIVTGDESFNFQAANNTVYYKNSTFASLSKNNFIHATCTHFKWGNGAVIADMKDGQFIFNYTVSSGLTTGNVSFKNDELFTSASVAKAWFKEQAENGTPVIVTCFIKG